MLQTMQAVIDVTSILIVWVIGIGCIPVMKKLQPESYKAYAIYVLAVCVLVTASVILYLCQK